MLRFIYYSIFLPVGILEIFLNAIIRLIKKSIKKERTINRRSYTIYVIFFFNLP